MADQTTKFRLEQIENRLGTLSTRVHDVASLAHECKLRLDASDLDKRLRSIEAWINEQKGKAMQNKAILGIIGLLAGLAGELLGKFL